MERIPISEKFALSTKEAAQYISIGENKVRQLCSSGEIVATRSGANWIIPKPNIETFILSKCEKGEII